MSRFYYTLEGIILNYESQEQDLGVIVNKSQEQDLGVIVNENLTWNNHHACIIDKTSQMLGLIKRTCHFLVNKIRKRTLYMAMSRSKFEHCPVSETELHKFETIQKTALNGF